MNTFQRVMLEFRGVPVGEIEEEVEITYVPITITDIPGIITYQLWKIHDNFITYQLWKLFGSTH